MGQSRVMYVCFCCVLLSVLGAAPPRSEEAVIARLEKQGTVVEATGKGLSRRAVSFKLLDVPLTETLFEDVLRLQGLKRVQICGSGLTDQQLARLVTLPRLTHLDISSNEKLTAKGLAHLRLLSTIEQLVLSHIPTITDNELPNLAGLKRLTKLGLSDTNVTDKGLAYVGKLESLEILQLGETQFSAEGLAQLSRLRNLKELMCGLMPMSAKEIRAISKLTALRVLILNDCELGDTTMQEFGRLPNLHELDLAANRAITDDGLAVLAKLKDLRILSLATTGVNGPGLKHLSELKELHTLHLSVSKIDDEGLKEVARLTQLRKLHLSFTKVTDEGLAHLVSLKNLEEIDLVNTKTTEKGRDRLKKALPSLKVLRYEEK